MPLCGTLATIFNRGGSSAGNPPYDCGDTFLIIDYKEYKGRPLQVADELCKEFCNAGLAYEASSPWIVFENVPICD